MVTKQVLPVNGLYVLLLYLTRPSLLSSSDNIFRHPFKVRSAIMFFKYVVVAHCLLLNKIKANERREAVRKGE